MPVTSYGPNLILFHLHPDVRDPGADACVVNSGATEIMMGRNDDVSDVVLTAGGLGGVVATVQEAKQHNLFMLVMKKKKQ